MSASAPVRTAAPPGVPPGPTPAPRLSRRAAAMAAAVVALLLAVLLSLAVGARSIPPGEVVDALLHGGNSDAAEVIRSMRVPRTLIGLMVGAALALAGAALQGITRNPIADPGILGISQGGVGGGRGGDRLRGGAHADRVRVVRLRRRGPSPRSPCTPSRRAGAAGRPR